MENIRKLPDSELEIMQAIWDCDGSATRREIGEKLSPERTLASTTLLTLLSRLAEKEFISIKKVGRASVYSPLVGRQEYISSQSGRFVKKLCGGSVSVLASALCDSGLSREELDELRELLKGGRI